MTAPTSREELLKNHTMPDLPCPVCGTLCRADVILRHKQAISDNAQGSGVRSEEVIAWLDIRTAGLSWQNRIVATNPQFVKSNGPENFAPLYVLGCPAEERVNFNGRMVTWAEIEAAVQEWKQRASPVASTERGTP